MILVRALQRLIQQSSNIEGTWRAFALAHLATRIALHLTIENLSAVTGHEYAIAF